MGWGISSGEAHEVWVAAQSDTAKKEWRILYKYDGKQVAEDPAKASGERPGNPPFSRLRMTRVPMLS